MRTNIVIPVKDFARAKRRLRGTLDAAHRQRLARLLYERTLSFLTSRFADEHVLVVTASNRAADIASCYGATVLREPAAEGLSAAAERGAAWSRAHGFGRQLLLAADIAELDYREIKQLLAQPPRACAVTICPAADAGTNALLTAPPSVITFAYGPRSSEAHRALAQRLGVTCTVLDLPHLRFDVDTGDDLDRVARQGGPLSREVGALCKTR